MNASRRNEFNDMLGTFSGALAELNGAREASLSPVVARPPGFLFSPDDPQGRGWVVCLGPYKIKASAGHGIESRPGAQRHRNTSPGCPPILKLLNALRPSQALILAGGRGVMPGEWGWMEV